MNVFTCATVWFSAAMVVGACASEATVLRVQPASTFETIGAALAVAVPGDTIAVKPGTYTEYGLRIDKPITLLGFGRPVLDAAGRGALLTVTCPGVTIAGFVLRNVPASHIKEHAAVLLDGVADCEIRDNRIEGCFFAIYLSKSERCRISGNEIIGSSTELTGSGNGIHLWNSRDIAIHENTIRGHRDGIYLEFVKHSRISGNTSAGNFRYGLHFMFSDSCRYEDNSFLRNGSGVAVMYTKNVDMTGNTFSESWGGASYGLLLKDIKDSRVVRNEFLSNSVGVHMEGSDRIAIEFNRFVDNGWAIRIMANCVDSDIRDNDFIDNSFQVATNSRQTFSRFDRNYWSAYRGYDLDRDGYGDEPFRPVSLYSLLVESEPATLVLVRSLLVDVLNLAERVVPTLTPEALIDSRPRMRPIT